MAYIMPYENIFFLLRLQPLNKIRIFVRWYDGMTVGSKDCYMPLPVRIHFTAAIWSKWNILARKFTRMPATAMSVLIRVMREFSREP